MQGHSRLKTNDVVLNSAPQQFNPIERQVQASRERTDDFGANAYTAQGATTDGKTVSFNQSLVNQLNSGNSHWTTSSGATATTISFGFTTSSSFAKGYSVASGYSPFKESQKAVAREVIGLWDDLTAARFVETTSGNTADIKFNNSTGAGYGYTYYAGTVGSEATSWQKIAGSAWFNPKYSTGTNNLVTPTHGTYGFQSFIHEIGHALGLKHGGTYNGSATYGSTSTGWLYPQDTHQNTVMSYFSSSHTGAAWNGKYAQTPMVYDVLAIQAKYGIDTTTRSGDTVYGFHANAGKSVFDFTKNTSPILTIWDAGGKDTIDLSGWSSASTLNLTAGSYSSVNGMKFNLAIAYKVDIENAVTGSGNDLVTGNDLANVITGNAGTDDLKGAGGNDTLNGGSGNDALVGGSGNDRIIGGLNTDKLTGGVGADTFVFDSLNASPTGSASDDVLDFNKSQADRIDLSAIDAITGGSNNAFHLTGSNGTAAFSHKGAASAGELRYFTSNSHTYVQGDVNGDGVADFQIDLAGSIALRAIDFIL